VKRQPSKEELRLESRLLEENFGLVVTQAKKFGGTSCSFEDMCQVGAIALLLAIRSFNPNRQVEWAAYASICIGRTLKKEVKKKFEVQRSFTLVEQPPLNLIGVLSETENRIIILRFTEGCALNEIAENVGFSRKKVSKILKAAINKLSRYYE